MEALVHHEAEPDRVRANTPTSLNERIDLETQARLQHYAGEDVQGLDERLSQLSREWDFERVLEAEAASMGIAGLALSLTVDRRFLLLPGFVAAMLLLHGVQGWYPLLPLFRGLGLRTQEEIDRERYALKALRGDFQRVPDATDDHAERAAAAWQAVCA